MSQSDESGLHVAWRLAADMPSHANDALWETSRFSRLRSRSSPPILTCLGLGWTLTLTLTLT